MLDHTSQLVEQRIVAFSLGHPGLGPRRISATLAQERWGGIVVSPNRVWRVLRWHGPSRRITQAAIAGGSGACADPEAFRLRGVPRPLLVARPGAHS